MAVAIITGAAGLIGSEAALFFGNKGFDVVGIDNNMRKYFFGEDGDTSWNQMRLQEGLSNYTHHSIDIRNYSALENLFSRYGQAIKVIIHCAAQPSHDWAAREPLTDFSINANGTLNLLELTRQHCKEAVFIFTSTNKVYGDTPNYLPLVEQEMRFEMSQDHPFTKGINESMSIDHSTHSLFGASKAAADLLVQEYGRYFGMKTACFRGGCLTGPNHSGAQLHGFLAYLVQCAITETPYTIFGYKGKQVRDNIHAQDLVNAFWHFFEKPRSAEVYNIGGGLKSNCSMLEAISIAECLSGKKMRTTYQDKSRIGDHIWYVSDLSRFCSHYPTWSLQYTIEELMMDIYEGLKERLVCH